ncbi:MAG: hypothetical protein GQ581_09780 [Methyloprofundus sp.]|nr:hypothetical protein [Methyloprofundus sp.]
MSRVSTVSKNRIYSQVASQFWGAWFIAIIWNGITWFAIIKGGNNILQAFEESPVFYFFVLFPFIGLFVIFSAVKQTLAWNKFGKTAVILNPAVGQVGGHCTGSITLDILPQDATQADISLSCKRRYVRQGSDGKSSSHEQVLWQDQVTLKPERYGRKKIQINFSFSPPSGLPISEEKSRDYHFWQLHIKVPVPGIDYDRIFELPMEAASELTAAVNSHISENQTSEVIENNRMDEKSTPKIKRTSHGTEFYYGYGRSKIMSMIIMSFGVFLGVFFNLFFDGFSDFLPVTAFLMSIYINSFAVGLFLLGLFLIINSLTVEVSLAGVRKQQKILGFKLEEFIEIDKVADILIEQGATSSSANGTRVWYALKLYTDDGEKIEVADSLEGQRYADSIRQEMINSLGSQWQAGVVDKSKKKVKKSLPRWLKWSGKLLSYSFTIAVMYDLSQFFPEVAELFAQIKF